jgi:hypothetical protein
MTEMARYIETWVREKIKKNIFVMEVLSGNMITFKHGDRTFVRMTINRMTFIRMKLRVAFSIMTFG